MGKNAINTKVNINSKNTKITSDGVLIAQGTNDLPDSTNIYMYLVYIYIQVCVIILLLRVSSSFNNFDLPVFS